MLSNSDWVGQEMSDERPEQISSGGGGGSQWQVFIDDSIHCWIKDQTKLEGVSEVEGLNDKFLTDFATHFEKTKWLTTFIQFISEVYTI